MTINRVIFKTTYELEDFAKLICPTCEAGHTMPSLDNIIEKQTIESLESVENIGYPECYEGRFNAIFKCSNPKCGENIFISGFSIRNEEYFKQANGTKYDIKFVPYYLPKYFSPAIKLISNTNTYPENIIKELDYAFALFWLNLTACGNSIRKCVEVLLDSFKIVRTDSSNNFVSLHNRIEDFKTKHSTFSNLADNLLAIKWIGNDASHKSEFHRDDIFDAFDILSYVLDEIYHNRTKQIEKLTKFINTNKGSTHS